MTLRRFCRPEYLVLAAAIGALVVVFLPERNSAPHDPVSQLAVITEIVSLREEVKNQLAREVADGSRSLFEAAVLFEELDRLAPRDLRAPDDVLAPQERVCWQVIDRVASRLNGDWKRAEILARLQTELRRALNQPGGIQFPDPKALESVERLLAEARRRIPRCS